VVAEDDPNDFLLLELAWNRAGIPHDLVRVEDGFRLLEFLRACERRPALLLLDIKMPGKNGHETLKELKTDPALRWLPVVMLSTSTEEQDVGRAYELGAATYFAKSAGLAEMTELLSQIRHGAAHVGWAKRAHRAAVHAAVHAEAARWFWTLLNLSPHSTEMPPSITRTLPVNSFTASLSM
jgi:CheY-like chemotaxis protein